MDVGATFQFRHSRILHVVPFVAYLFLSTMEKASFLRFYHRRSLRDISRRWCRHAHLCRLTQHEGGPGCYAHELCLPRSRHSWHAVAQFQGIEAIRQIDCRHFSYRGPAQWMLPLGYSGIEQDELAARLDVAYFAHSDVVWMVGELCRQTFTNRFVRF